MIKIGRQGTTLIEVLVAIFVMAIGLIALLGLFPLGALQMAQAIKDDRAASCAANATSLAIAWNLRHDPLVTQAFNNPNTVATHVNASDPASLATGNHPWADGPSYAVYVDPGGSLSFLPPYTNWVAGVAPPPLGVLVPAGQYGVARRNISWIANQPTAALQQFWTLQSLTLTDEIFFDNKGTPKTQGGTQFERDLAFSFAYLLRRPRMSQPGVVEMSVIVYQRRPLGLNAAAGIGNPSDENWFNASFPLNNYVYTNPPRTVTLSAPSATQPLPALRPGNWILDCSPGQGAAGAFVDPGLSTVAGKATPGSARFYRVVAVTEGAVGSLDIEVDNPLLPRVVPPLSSLPAQPPSNFLAPTRFAVLEGVAEVFDKGTSWVP
jgi:hypothetical protein